MSSKVPLILVTSLNINRGGVTKSALTYANSLVKKYKKVFIGTFLYQRNYQEIINELYKEGYLDKRVKVLNMFEDTKPYKNKKNVIHKVKEKNLIEFQDYKQDKPSFRYFKNGVYAKYKRFTENGELIFIDYMDNSRQRIMREEYNTSGLLARRRHISLRTNKSILDQYFDDRKKCYLTIWINPETSKETKFFSFNEKNKEFDSLNHLRSSWLQDVIKNIDNPVLMIDIREIDNLVKYIDHPNLKTIAILHNNHYKSPYKNGAELKPGHHFLFNNSNLFDRIVCLTESQKQDIEENFSLFNKIEVIPHTVESVDNRVEMKTNVYNPLRVVSIARFENQKRLDEAIRAFRLVVDKIPSAKYMIYGTGNQKEMLQELINKLNLQENVELKEYTQDPLRTFKEAACSILTSDLEGFGRVVAESLYSGTPVVSYDINYGPSEIIRNNVDGFIVEKGNREELAEKVIDILENEKLRNQLSTRAIEVKDRFSYKRFKQSWLELIKEI